ncbi:Polynucleotide adenylyltransferase [Fusarium sp. Ph1]|nr:Polynucleotide adenylyltransferase [Fusarium sp. Ph1]
MDTQTTTAEPQHPYPPSPWNTVSTITSSTTSSTTASTTSSHSAPAADGSFFPDPAATQFHSHLDFLPFLLPQQSNIYHAQLLHYNKLISPARGGGLQTPPLPPVVSAPHIQAAPRSRSSSKVSLKDASAGKGNTGGGHGSRSHQNSDKSRSVVTSKEVPPKMPSKQSADSSRPLPRRSAPSAQSHSSSVPSTPHQHARQFSFEDREPSPTGTNNHSPRSAYSETNSTLPSLRPLPPRLGGCKYETAQINSRRRIPYSVGNDRLEKLDLQTVKSKLTEDEERKLATDMREVYDRLLPTAAVEENRKKLVLKLEKIFNDEWPGHDIRVNLFGSSGNLLCSDDSDVDICITTSWRELEGVCMIADLLARRGMEKVVCISAAKVPIVKIWDPELGLACDMNVNNTLALENTRMVRTYIDTDPRVRELAMIVKYWTRRRIVNDAAFGGTLSSYTWICLIIAFLQLRSPPVLPALHQLSHKLPRPDGTMPDFADDLKKLSGFGNKNKSSVAELLFQFFRFYAHEFDYDKHVLSVRLGKLVTKHEKKWHYAINNQLCVEEPFNTSRNLGNTADEYSFRGLHMELRRAFDLISVANLEEACEPYVFPKEEERVWSRPPPQSRPVLLRSSSQTHSGRGGRGNHRGGRHNNNFHRNNGGNRRASSGVPQYDANNNTNNVYIPQVNMQQDLQWYQNPQFQFQYTQQDLMTQMAYHQENMRLLYASQSPAFMQHQAQAQAQAMNQQQQRMSASTGSNQQQQQQQSTDRSRTNSFDNPPLSAPLRPDLYALYGMTLGGPFFPQAGGYGTYPSSPASTNGATQDFRRSMQRSGANNEAGGSTNGTLRSHSQPASRSPSAQAAGNYFGNQQVNGANSRSMNGVPIPSFMSDDTDFDETPKAHADSPQSEEGKYAAFYLTESPSPGKQSQKSQPGSNGIAFGDLSQNSSPGRRRLSTDQLPQTILDRRMRRTSRSPSPLGHSRAFSASTASAPLAQAPFPGSQNKNLSRPLVVNGSCLKTSVIQSPRQPSGSESNASEDSSNFENPLQINVGNGVPSYPVDGPIVSSSAPEEATAKQGVSNQVPVVANGTTPHMAPSTGDDPSFRERILMMNTYYMAASNLAQEPVAGTSRLSPSTRQRLMSRQQNGIAPLDLAIAEHRIDRPVGQDFAHLSPVYENRTPSPTVVRKPDGPLKSDKQATQNSPKASRGDGSKAGQKPDERVQDPQDGSKPQKGQKATAQSQKVNGVRENGHVRGAKSESDGGWQKAGKGKKKGANNAANQGNGEQLPKLESERKGG